MARRRRVIEGAAERPVPAAQGAIEGAERLSRETARWSPSMRHPDVDLNSVKPMADARSEDMVRNDGYTQGAVNILRDSIVGHAYRLNLRPAFTVLARYNKAFDEAWAEEYQEAVEETFNLVSESEGNWLDAARRLTFTGLVRLGVASWGQRGEIVASAEWIREADRPFATAAQIISPDRLSNPQGVSDTQFLRRGVVRDRRGRPISYHIRDAHPGDPTAFMDQWTWTEVKAEKPWGRKQILHVLENAVPDQTRAVADMVAVLKHMRMTKTYQDVMLQNAVVNATYAAAIESELPTELVQAMMGNSVASDGYSQALGTYLGGLAEYLSGSSNVALDGVKIPHLYPNTKLNVQKAGTPGGIGTDFEASLLRHVAAGLGLSYEEFSRDYTKTNYSSAKAAFAHTERTMNARKKFIADRFASDIFTLWLEEQFSAGWIPLPRGVTREVFYLPFAKDAFAKATWIGAGRGQIDEMKETQAAVLRIKSGLSTGEAETALIGGDWRANYRQLAREKKLAKKLGLDISLDATKPDQQSGGNTLRGDSNQDQAE